MPNIIRIAPTKRCISGVILIDSTIEGVKAGVWVRGVVGVEGGVGVGMGVGMGVETDTGVGVNIGVGTWVGVGVVVSLVGATFSKMYLNTSYIPKLMQSVADDISRKIFVLLSGCKILLPLSVNS